MFDEKSGGRSGPSVVHILPRLPPAADGVGDYVARLGEFWPQPQPNWAYVVRAEAAPSRLSFPASQIEECGTCSEKLCAALEATGRDCAVLHYVGYGFHARGCPFWLARGLKDWKQKSRGRKVVVMFHELYALTPIWQTAFWLRPLAKAVISHLIRIADRCLISCPQYRDKLLDEFSAPAEKLQMIPIGANILPANPDQSARDWPLGRNSKLKVVIFGLGLTRIWALRAHTNLLRALFRDDLLDSITLLGKGGLTPKWTAHLSQLKAHIAPDSVWKESYDLSSAQVSECLAGFDLGMVSNWPAILTKSGVFAALSAHGIPSVISRGKRPDVSYSFPDAFFINDDRPAGIKRCLEDFLRPDVVKKKHQALDAFYHESLSWNNITHQWNNVLLGL